MRVAYWHKQTLIKTFEYTVYHEKEKFTHDDLLD